MSDLNNSPQNVAARLARQLAELARVAEVGLGLCREIVAKVRSAQGLTYDPSLAYSRISRAVRLTIVLENRIAAEHQLLLEGKASGMDERRFAKAKAVVLDVLNTAIETELKHNPDCDRERLTDMADSLPKLVSAHLDREDLLETAPITEVIEIISEALDIPIDWSLWKDADGVAEDWKPDCYRPNPADDPPEVNKDTEPVLS